MSQYFQIHPETPQQRLIHQSVEILKKGGVIAYPTDSAYALGCRLDDKQAMDRIRKIRNLDERHHFTLVCRDLSEIGVYARVNNTAFRLLKAHTPGPYTFILAATREVPRRLLHPKRKTIGLRVPDNNIAQALVAGMGEPLVSTTLQLPGDDLPLADPEEIRERLERQVDLVIDGGHGPVEPTTVVDFVEEVPEVVRRGAGDPSAFEGQG